ncbi:DUF4198 domain-containing protein [Sulfitobacter sp. F26204]|uniref:DUF4198 domain-containing protein n=1 Tax=Sulfitobacter sp. F26204 TaxID=2996014 RepID=UPI00225E41EE|nr:DUF4198 domain-containing protein [Sulfitobacter sp. F26204]MCX7559850.1 DUF4198 domain-containing protein [Sulfitobacter sp. F26204]
MFLPRIAAVLLCSLPIDATAHEFWLEPLAYQVDGGQKLQAHFRNGQEFQGNSLSFFDRSSTRFDMIVGGKVTALQPRSGDSPALDVKAPVEDGLVSVVHETSTSLLTYNDWHKFLKFAAHKAFETAAAEHIKAGWSQEKFRERYSRHVKTLFAVGSGKGADSESGMKTEFVAITNPYDPNFNNNMKVALLFDGAPRSDAQIEVFDRAPDEQVTITLHRTDSHGTATIPVSPGHEYLFDGVVLRAADDASSEKNAIVWETYWAALTFSVPE